MAYFSAMRVAAYGDSEAMPAHCHDADVISLPLGGSYFERIRGRETKHCLGDVLLCPAHEAHSQIFPDGRVVKLLMTLSATGRGYVAEHLQIHQAPFTRAREFEPMAIRLAHELGRDDLQSALIAEGIGLEILGLFARAESGEADIPPWLRAARDFVRANACAAIRLPDVAAHVGRDAPRVAIAYRRAFGCTIGEDARSLRLRAAAAMLASTKESIAAIASDCGYFDQAHFTRAFQKSYGIAPGAYRTAFH
jgi:AraC family transcriptional regulator